MATSPTSGPGGGGEAPTTRANYNGNAVSIANTSIAALTWDTLFAGTELLDRTDPANPTILTAGVYAVTIMVFSTGLTAGGRFSASLELDTASGGPAVGYVQSPSATASDDEPAMTLAVTYYLPAGAVVLVGVKNLDGVAARDFSLSRGAIQQIS